MISLPVPGGQRSTRTVGHGRRHRMLAIPTICGERLYTRMYGMVWEVRAAADDELYLQRLVVSQVEWKGRMYIGTKDDWIRKIGMVGWISGGGPEVERSGR